LPHGRFDAVPNGLLTFPGRMGMNALQQP